MVRVMGTMVRVVGGKGRGDEEYGFIFVGIDFENLNFQKPHLQHIYIDMNISYLKLLTRMRHIELLELSRF